MLSSFLSRFRRRASADFPPPLPSESFIAVGDIHGRYDLLEQLTNEFVERSDISKWVFVGDYIDRGENSPEVLLWLHQLACNWDGVICLRGNHEDMLLNFLQDPASNGVFWLRNGGWQTIASYGLDPLRPSDPKDDWNALGKNLRNKMGDDLIAWLKALPTQWQSGNVFCVHAGANPALPMNAQDDQDLIWGHNEFFRRPRQDGAWIIHGHTIVDDVLIDEGRISIDTGAFATGRLSGVIVTDKNIEPMTTQMPNKLTLNPL